MQITYLIILLLISSLAFAESPQQKNDIIFDPMTIEAQQKPAPKIEMDPMKITADVKAVPLPKYVMYGVFWNRQITPINLYYLTSVDNKIAMQDAKDPRLNDCYKKLFEGKNECVHPFNLCPSKTAHVAKTLYNTNPSDISELQEYMIQYAIEHFGGSSIKTEEDRVKSELELKDQFSRAWLFECQ